jgi:hypothetical protein
MEGPQVDDGHATIQALKTWYGSANTSCTIIEDHRMKLQELQLDKKQPRGCLLTALLSATIVGEEG